MRFITMGVETMNERFLFKKRNEQTVALSSDWYNQPAYLFCRDVNQKGQMFDRSPPTY